MGGCGGSGQSKCSGVIPSLCLDGLNKTMMNLRRVGCQAKFQSGTSWTYSKCSVCS